MAQQKTTIKINPKYNAREREAIAQEIIDYMVERTNKGKDKNNRKFQKYSKEYKESLDFKIAGKSKSKVNLQLSGDMLSSMETLNTRKGSVTIGFDKGDEENNGKAEGNIKGTYGNKSPVTRPRDFLGISGNDLRRKVLSKFPLTDKQRLLDQVFAHEKSLEESEDFDVE